MKLLLPALAFLGMSLHGADVVMHDQSYFKADVRNTELIYTEKNLPYARQAAMREAALQPLYEATFGYIMDEPLHVGLISEYNQIANGFSTQYPNNRQINYIGGALMGDYFASTSWIDTLLYHESAHNYQMNAKANPVSSSLHTVIGNGTFIIFPWFTVPNMLESSFMAEGNAVLNESWHGNGGRLYSGRFKAATLMQAKARYLTPERVYNNNLYFLYGSHHYTLGGFYHYDLAERYGIDAVNAYWREHSKDWYWPFFTNNAMERAIGVDFETSFAAWASRMANEALHVKEPQGEMLATSQFFAPLNSDAQSIYFLINESGRERPELVVIDKATGRVTKERDSWMMGKVVYTKEGHYATQASGQSNPWRIWIGLYDDDGMLLEGTESKVIEGYLQDGRAVYLDVPSSFDQPQLYVGDTFVAQVNSSVFIDDDDTLYYFVQEAGKKRTLYGNKTPLLSISGYESHVCGTDESGALYFIAPSRYGSSLYRFDGEKITRASSADTIFDARIINAKTAVIAAMGSDAYMYEKIALETLDETPFEVTLFVENLPRYRAVETQTLQTPAVDTSQRYHALGAMNYSGTNFDFGSSSAAGFLFNASVNFADPLMMNQFSLFAARNGDEYTIGGLGYSNSEYFVQFLASVYGVMERPETNSSIDDSDRRDFGVMASATVPFVATGYWRAALNGSYYQDYESHSRTPLSLSLALQRAERHGVSMYPNTLFSLTPYAAFDRGESAYGGSLRMEQGVVGELYASLSAQYSQSSAGAGESRGIKITPALSFDGDPTTVLMPALKDTLYAKKAFKATAELRQVLNGACYFFTFPLSLQRESLFAGYTRYELAGFAAPDTFIDINEAYAGITFASVMVHRLEVPLTFRYIYNDSEIFAHEQSFSFSFGMDF